MITLALPPLRIHPYNLTLNNEQPTTKGLTL
jgi:hypothetical protein